MKPNIYLVFILFLSSLGLKAQDGLSETKTIALKVACLNTLDDASKVFIDGYDKAIQLNIRHPSGSLRTTITKGQNLKIYKAAGLGPGELVGSVVIPFEVTSATLILYTREKKYRGILVNEADFPSGSVYLLNTSTSPVGLELANGGKVNKKILKRGESYTFRPSQDSSSGTTVAVKMSIPSTSSQWKTVYSSSWRVVNSRREMVVLYSKKGSSRLFTKGISDFSASVKVKSGDN